MDTAFWQDGMQVVLILWSLALALASLILLFSGLKLIKARTRFFVEQRRWLERVERARRASNEF